MSRLPQGSCCTKSCVNAGRTQRIRNEVLSRFVGALRLADAWLCRRSRGLHLHQLHPGCADRATAAAPGCTGKDHSTERFKIAAEESFSPDFFHIGLEIDRTRWQAGAVCLPAL